jgi:DnaJ-domain-containing protein 1
MNTLPFENIPYENINSIGKQWIRRFALALSKETLGQIRGKFGGSIPIPGDNISLNASDLLSQAKDEQQTLREELKTQLDEMTYQKLIANDSEMTDNAQNIVAKTPLKIFVG